jgi:TRAP-type C4-dicarboxylate transport system permease large subunit
MIIYALQDDTVTPLGLFMAASSRYHCGAMMITNGSSACAMATSPTFPSLTAGMIVNSGEPCRRCCCRSSSSAACVAVSSSNRASVVAVVYALLVGKYVYRTLQWKMVPVLLSRTAILTSSVLIIVAASNAFAWVLTTENVPQVISEWIAHLGLGPIALLLLVNVFLLVFGIFIEPLPGVMVLVPILAPVAAKLGIDPIHFAMIVIYNLTLGMITPPVGGRCS